MLPSLTRKVLTNDSLTFILSVGTEAKRDFWKLFL